jgi:Tol biopolymer transport system component
MLTRFHWISLRHYRWLFTASLSLMLLLQACGGGNNNNFNSHNTNGSGNINTNSAAKFDGNVLFVKNHNIFVLSGKDSSVKQLTTGNDTLQPALSPDGSTIVFQVRKAGNDYSDIGTMPLAGGNISMLTDDSLHDTSTGAPYHYEFWAANPIWTSDGKNIIYLSDFYKGGKYSPLNPNCVGAAQRDWIVDPGIVEIPSNRKPVPVTTYGQYPTLLAWPYCYAGGDQNLFLRPGVSDTEILFTSFQYVGAKDDLISQLYVLKIPASGRASMIALNPPDPKALPMEASWSPDGRYITYIRRENGEDNLYIMPVPATIASGTPDGFAPATAVYYTNTAYYAGSQRLAEGIYGNPVWGDNNTLFFMEFNNDEFDLYEATVKFSTPVSAATTPTPGVTPTAATASAPVIALNGTPVQLTDGGIDGDSAPVWFH